MLCAQQQVKLTSDVRQNASCTYVRRGGPRAYWEA